MTDSTLALLALLALLEEHEKKCRAMSISLDLQHAMRKSGTVGRESSIVPYRSSRAGPVPRCALGPHQDQQGTDPAQGERGSVSR